MQFRVSAARARAMDATSPLDALVNGSAGNDSLMGTPQADTINGLDGDDTIDGLGGADRLDGGDGDDEIKGGEGVNTLLGGAGVDRLWGGSESDSLLGGEGDDFLHGESQSYGGGVDTLNGGGGADYLRGGNGKNLLIGGAGDDSIGAGWGRDTVRAGDGDDHLELHHLDAALSGSLDGGANTAGGADFLSARLWFGQAKLDLAAAAQGIAQQLGGGFTVVNVEQVSIDGGESDDTIKGWIHNDTIGGNYGADLLRGGGGDDFISGGYGGPDRIYGDAGEDFIQIWDGGLADGGAGNDRIHADTVNTDSPGAELRGGDGDDSIRGRDGADTVAGGRGTDTLDAGWGGIDTVSCADARKPVTIDIEDNIVTGSLGTDTLVDYFENAIGGRGDDVLIGSFAANILSGGGGGDRLQGESGADVLIGGSGDDTLVGGSGGDVMRGGTGADVFVMDMFDAFSAPENRILDLGMDDLVDLSPIDASTRLAGDQAFKMVGQFSGKAGQLTMSFDRTTRITTLEGDTDGNGVADFLLKVESMPRDFDNFVL